MNIEPPHGFIDRIPRRGQWFDPAAVPDEFETVEILNADGTTDVSTWTGKVWWRGFEQHPIGWRRIDGFGISYHPKA